MTDHLVYVVPGLSAAAARFIALGLPPSPGGRHLSRGTHNLLLRFGPRSYLELLAVDPLTSVAPPRWMGIDAGPLPRISRWALSAGAAITERAPALAAFPGTSTAVQRGERQLPDGRMLRWQLSDPGTTPAVSSVPFLIDWGEAGSPHPADDLPDLGLKLHALRLFHPEAPALQAFLRACGSELVVHQAPEARIAAVFTTPRGELIL